MAREDDLAWLCTYMGRKVFFLDPLPGEICIEDIAHHLALTNRFCGATREPYSVAQHSVEVSLQCGDHRWGLMHDAAEAYLGDVHKPLKNVLTDYAGIESAILAAVAEKFGLGWPMPEEVHEVDTRMLVTEARDLLAEVPIGWGRGFGLEGVEPYSWRVMPVGWREAEKMFLERFDNLFSA